MIYNVHLLGLTAPPKNHIGALTKSTKLQFSVTVEGVASLPCPGSTPPPGQRFAAVNSAAKNCQILRHGGENGGVDCKNGLGRWKQPTKSVTKIEHHLETLV